MYGIVLAAHGDVAPALLKAAEAIVGGVERVRAVSLQSGSDPERMRAQVAEAVHEVDAAGEGALVLVDMFGGTPSNVCLSCGIQTPVEVVTGVNLPMLLKATMLRETKGLEESAEIITTYGQRHIAHATRLVREKRAAEAAANAQKPGDAQAAAR